MDMEDYLDLLELLEMELQHHILNHNIQYKTQMFLLMGNKRMLNFLPDFANKPSLML
jgi:hypothetical protein